MSAMTVGHGTTGATETGGAARHDAVPPMVGLALRAALVQMALMVVTVGATYLLEDTLRSAWLTARAASTGQTIDAVRESSVEPPSFFPVVLTLVVTYVMLALVLVAMVRVGARWAHYSLTVLVVVTALVQLVLGTTGGVPVVLMLLAAACVALHGLTVLLLWHPANKSYFRTAHNGHWAVAVGDERPAA